MSTFQPLSLRTIAPPTHSGELHTGNCWANAWSESFFASLKSECFPENAVFESKALARRTIFDYLETFYNRSRLHSSLAYISPEDYVARYYQNPKLN